MIINNLPAPDSLGKEIINSIASMCVDDGGQATIFAREIQSTYDFIEYEDEELCDSVSFRSDIGHYPNEFRILSDAFIFPNPTEGSIFLHGPASNGTFILRNITGSVLISRYVNMTNRSILIDGIDFLNPGLYILQFIGTKNEINESGILVRQ